jgi:ferrous iron transport protein B
MRFYQIGNLIANGVFGFGTVVAFALVICLIYLLFRKGYKPDEHTKAVTSVDAAGK